MISFQRVITSTVLIIGVTAGVFAQRPKGHLVIIGGGTRTEAIMSRFVELAGGTENARIIILPHASSEPETTGRRQAEELKQMGVRHVDWMVFTREQTSSAELLTKLDGVTGVFFSGGDQIRVTRAMLGTPVHRKLMELYRNGAVLGGTSAGAAIMSKVMITGEELIIKDSVNAFKTIMKGNVETVEGLGFLDNVIIDQHFIKRKRLNRLISVVLEHPNLPGIGIDESTALLVNPDGTFEVLGESGVMVFDARRSEGIHLDAHQQFGARKIETHLFTEGERFTMDFVPVTGASGR